MKMTEHDKEYLLYQYRRILDSIHALGNVYYDDGRMQAYSIVAKLSSDLRRSNVQA